VDFRVICATNENLRGAVREGRFREDFYYRINVFTIELPPLRARRSDIPALAEHFLRRFALPDGQAHHWHQPRGLELLTAYDWPGNVRELSNAIRTRDGGGRPPAIRPDDLPLRRPPQRRRRGRQSLADVERRHVAAVLERAGWNVTQAAEILKVDRVTVYNKIKKYGLRLVKEAVHELGHTYGLVHCNRARCVMTSSTYVENIDLKSAQLCDRCRAELRADATRGMVATPG
jgi:DNA-binding NtrC family response regulator